MPAIHDVASLGENLQNLEPESKTSMTEAAPSNDQEPNQAGIRFLNFPAEIRNHIYNEALINDGPIKLKQWPPYISEPALLSACKQVRREALAIFYECNTFSSGDEIAVKAMFMQLRRSKLAMLRSIRSVSYQDFYKLAANVSDPSFIHFFSHNGDKSSPRLQGRRLVLRRLRKLGAELLDHGRSRGVRADAVLLPLVDSILTVERWDTIEWVSAEEHKKYDAMEEGGRDVLVKMDAD